MGQMIGLVFIYFIILLLFFTFANVTMSLCQMVTLLE